MPDYQNKVDWMDNAVLSCGYPHKYRIGIQPVFKQNKTVVCILFIIWWTFCFCFCFVLFCLYVLFVCFCLFVWLFFVCLFVCFFFCFLFLFCFVFCLCSGSNWIELDLRYYFFCIWDFSKKKIEDVWFRYMHLTNQLNINWQIEYVDSLHVPAIKYREEAIG